MPMIGCNKNKTNRKIGVQGISRIGNKEEPEKRRRIVERSPKPWEEDGLHWLTDLTIDPLRTKPPKRLASQVPICEKTRRRIASRKANVVNDAKTRIVRKMSVSTL